jgi:DNA polymerase elongation subunit (family B)
MEGFKVFLLDVDYVMEGEKPVLRLWGKARNGKTVVVLDRGFRPYFYAVPKAESGLDELAKRIKAVEVEEKRPLAVEKVEKTFLGKAVAALKITVEYPPDVPKFRDSVKEWDEVKEEYEYAISFHKRYLIDKGLCPLSWIEVEGKEITGTYDADVHIEAEHVQRREDEQQPKLTIMAFDIETVEEKGNDRIVLLSLVDSLGFKKVMAVGKRAVGVEQVVDEKELLEQFSEYVKKRDPDILVGYNSDAFDFQKLVLKAELAHMPLVLGRDKKHVIFKRIARTSAAVVSGRAHVDLYAFIKNIMAPSLSTEVLTLDRVSQELVGEGKETLSFKEIGEVWNSGKVKQLAEYCLQDSRLTLKLADRILPQLFEICRVVGQTLFDGSRMSYSQLVEWLLIRRAFQIHELIPNTPKYDEIQRRRKAAPYEGGYVIAPTEGIHDKIALFDFHSLYPTITITHNVSPETLNGKGGEIHKVPGEDYHFAKEQGKHGFIPGIINELVERRIEIQKKIKKVGKRSHTYRSLFNRQHALKVLANASYGYYAYPGSRWYSRVCAQSIAAWGRFYIKKVMEQATRMHLSVIYGDTDSLFLKIQSKKQALAFLKKANNSLPGIMELDFTGLYKSGIFVKTKTGVGAKKRYALIDYDNKITIRGFETVRRDWASIAKDTQEKVLIAVLKDRSPEKAVRIVRKIITNIRRGDVPLDELTIYTQLTKPLSEYEQIGPHVAAARKLQQRGGTVREGATISYIITKGTGSISSRAEPADDARDYDDEYYIYHQVLPAALRVLSGLGCTEDYILGKEGKQSGLEGFLKR